jgi:hypothetical protein
MGGSTVLLAIAVCGLGCAHLNPSEAAYEAQLEEARERAAASGIQARTEPPDAWWHREIEAREARIAALRERVEIADQRRDEEAEDVKGRLERELVVEKESLRAFTKVSTKHHSDKMIAGGVALTLVGGVSLVTTGYVALRAWAPAYETSRKELQEDARAALAFGLSLGVSCLAAGVPLLVIGARKVVKPEPAAGLWVGPGDLGVRGSF